ncbi:MAG: Gfo/Idh/MocA family oxidoreductase [Sphingobacteriales bacterium]|nr:MAG: Gfo/Idh/MocA family oxidoreductase [Sphingobacteriales bacterium]
MNSDRKIKFAVVGCGHIGKRHAAVIQQQSQAELVALIDVKDQNDLDIAAYANIQFYNSIESFLALGTDVDVVNICTPNAFHSAQAIACLQSGKHVVIEKPMALTAGDAQAVITQAAEVNKEVFVVMQNRYSPPSAWINDVVKSGRLGKIFAVHLNCFWNRDERYYKAGSWHGTKDIDGGTLFTQFSHFIDVMYWLFGDIENINARLQNFNHSTLTQFEDSGTISFDFKNGGVGTMNFSTSVWEHNMESSIIIIAENGSVKIGGQYMDKVEYCSIKEYVMPLLQATNPGNNYGSYRGSAMNHQYIIDNVIEVLNGRATVTTTAQEGYHVVDMIERIYSAANTIK